MYQAEGLRFHCDTQVELIIQAGGGNSSVRKRIAPETWTEEVKAFHKASGKTFYIYNGSDFPENASYYIDDIKILKLI